MNPDQPTAASPTAAAQHPPVLAVVVPCYKEEKALPLSMPRLLEVLDTLTDTGEIDSERRRRHPQGCVASRWPTTEGTSTRCWPDS